MTIKKFEIGVVGTSMQAALIAGLLARDHNKQVCMFIEGSIPLQLPRELGLSFDCSIRPKMWKLLEESVGESVPIIAKIGGSQAVQKVSPLILCKGKAGGEALSHMYHLLHGNEYEIERLSGRDFESTTGAFRVRGVRMVRAEIMWPELIKWLKIVGVVIIDPADMQLSLRRDGSGSANTSAGTIALERLVLADERSILAYGDEGDIERLFNRCQTSTIITKPVGKSSEQLILNPEHRFSARAKPSGGFEVLADVAIESLGALMGDFVDNNSNFKLMGRTVFNSLKSKDGAPIIGKSSRSLPWMVGGFGYAGIFLAPAIARYLMQESSEAEQGFFTSHPANNKRNSQKIADYCGLGNRQQ